MIKKWFTTTILQIKQKKRWAYTLARTQPVNRRSLDYKCTQVE